MITIPVTLLWRTREKESCGLQSVSSMKTDSNRAFNTKFITNINVSLDKRLRDLTVSAEVIKHIREELKELRILYKQLVEKLIPTEEPTSEEKRAIQEKDEIADERQIMNALGKTNARSST